MQRLIVTRLDMHFVNALKLWASLYLLIWLGLAQFLVTALSGVPGVIYLHFVVGLVVLAVALVNYRGLMRTSAPDRVKRISKVIPGMATFDGLLGIPLFLFREGTIHWAVNLLHLIIAVAIITQASSEATAYDMWEEKEFN